MCYQIAPVLFFNTAWNIEQRLIGSSAIPNRSLLVHVQTYYSLFREQTAVAMTLHSHSQILHPSVLCPISENFSNALSSETTVPLRRSSRFPPSSAAASPSSSMSRKTSSHVMFENGGASTSQTVPGSGTVPFCQYARTWRRLHAEGSPSDACCVCRSTQS